ncbi:MAG TPA: hypothetical protein VE954_12650, partial [Oligoflexus sp.]|uniref:hypothetical protein n=1 Tax=Oligoflexus sp. TaxID=1971216 RepID=UPI002D54894F
EKSKLTLTAIHPRRHELQEGVALLRSETRTWRSDSSGPGGRKSWNAHRIRGNEIFYMERLLLIAADPYITSRAKSICFLFGGLDCALKNKAEIVEKAGLALMRAQSQQELGEVLGELPEFIQKKSRNFGKSSDAVVRHLLQDPINEAKNRLGIEADPLLPSDERGLKSEIERLLKTDLTELDKAKLKSILDALPRLNFGYCLGMYTRLSSRLKAEATQ